MKKLVFALSFLSLAGLANATDYSEGQVWSYKTRLGEEGSTVLIDKVETHVKLGKIFHISIDGVKIKISRSGATSTELPHLPVSEETLKKSLTELLGKRAPNPKYLEGYKLWKAAFDSGRAGIYTLSIAEIVSAAEQIVNKQ